MKKLLLFLSKTDLDIYKECPQSAKDTQVGFGLFVLLTGILAFCSGTYAILNMFTEFDWKTETVTFNTSGYVIAPLLGIFYALMIIAIDREVVAAKSKTTALMRLCLAIVIGIIVAIPIELKLLEGRIEKQLIQNYKIENSNETVKKETAFRDLATKKSRLEKRVNDAQEKVDYWSKIMTEELAGRGISKKKGEGKVYRDAKRNMQLHQNNVKNETARLTKFLETEYRDEKESIEKKFEKDQVVQQFDLLSKFQALEQIVEEDKTGSTWWMSWGIRILFVLFEIIPSLIKIMTQSTEYDSMIEARRRMNIQLINTEANRALEDLENDDYTGQTVGNYAPKKHIHQIKTRIIT
ncbi:uncharacterized protein DUF4407 [Kordia periserrulae]|uniref:Uncharacterized protein DUF4407 n=1 Tax=Kordia periserrulae TaxID=701523 RepID=A0A2T6BYE5_9FLAO|nr:DUF4407 domain-containing protein [Kordia periserrulae]PTX61101.1 uncharacterized protein DUF4407 [Kordia periserrulae]